MDLRNPAVAGQFYSGTETALKREVVSYIDKASPAEDCYGGISPHAGYVYSGAIAGMVLSRIKLKDGLIILGPNHTGMGEPFAMASARSWRTPLGDVDIDAGLSEAILKNSTDIKQDDSAHAFEHSIEVILPFLQVINQDFDFVPIAIGTAALDTLRRVGASLAKGIKAFKKGVTVITSSDMTHFESAESAKAKDKKAIDAIIALDEERLARVVSADHITMCGVAPAIVMITALKALGATKAELIGYATSGDISGDNTNVVGYAGLLVK